MSLLITSKQLFEQPEIPVFAASVESRPLMRTDFHRHEYYEMIYVGQGTIVNSLTSEEIVLGAGDLLIIKPYVRHVLKAIDPSCLSTRAYVCSFLPQIVDSRIHTVADAQWRASPNSHFFRPFASLANDATSAVVYRIEPGRRDGVERLFQAVEEASKSAVASIAAKRRWLFLQLLSTLADDYLEDCAALAQVESEDAFLRQVSTSDCHGGLQTALNYLHSHINQHVTLGEIAERSGVSISYFSILIKQATGMTFVNYLNNLRVERASSLLRCSTEKLVDICSIVGFKDYSHFSRNFKKTTGLSPRAYRQQKRVIL
ncbi:MAG: helix-turn-helix domain-containing protein [Opitutaceae bacterium]